MIPIRTPATDAVLGAPWGWDESAMGPCAGLPVHRAADGLVSWWRPGWRERLAVLLGRPVRLVVAGSAHPPVMLDTEAPPRGRHPDPEPQGPSR